MRTAFLGMAIPIVCLLATFCYAQSTSGFQSVGGDFGQDWISSFKVQNFRLADQNPKNDLWIWGGAPKGSIIVNGRLVADPYYFWKSLNYTRGWLGRVWVDPRTGYPIYAYIEPHTRRTMYFYVDPYTQKPVYLNGYPAIGTPYYGGVPPFYSYIDRSIVNMPPSIFR